MNQAADFDGVAGLYSVARPSYPTESVDWLVGRPNLDVVDVGAGTGLFTRLLLPRCRSVIAIDPSAEMLAQLRTALPEVEARRGSGERMPVPDASADLVTFAQAWHWVDPVAASREAARVLRPGGILGLVWNLRDERVPWVRALGAAMLADGDHYRGAQDDPVVHEPFGGIERSYVEWVRVCTPDEIAADVRSRSYFGLLPEDEQASTLGRVAEVVAPQVRDGVVALPYVTAASRHARG